MKPKYNVTPAGCGDEPPAPPPPTFFAPTEGNEVWFYQDVSAQSLMTLRKSLIETDKRLRKLLIDHDGYNTTCIKLRMNTDGGEAISAIALANDLVRRNHHTLPIVAYNDGLVASAGTLIYAACDVRVASAGSWFLIHNLSGMLIGNLSQIKDNAKMMERLKEQLANLYLERSKLSRDQVEQMMERETWLTAQEAKEYGLVDYLIGEAGYV